MEVFETYTMNPESGNLLSLETKLLTNFIEPGTSSPYSEKKALLIYKKPDNSSLHRPHISLSYISRLDLNSCRI
jgi:hypothetical protein